MKAAAGVMRWVEKLAARNRLGLATAAARALNANFVHWEWPGCITVTARAIGTKNCDWSAIDESKLRP
jgi:hypothetical protein